jgi:hypothetical protein
MTAPDLKQRLLTALGTTPVVDAARAVRERGPKGLAETLTLARALAEALGDDARAAQLDAELIGYENVGLEVPPERRVGGYASPFPVRAIGLLEPEEIFIANREKFSQVTLTIGQPVRDLEAALEQIQQGGVLALKVPASEVTGESALTDPDTEVFIYVLPREIERLLHLARRHALDTIVAAIAGAAVGASSLVDDDFDITSEDVA